MVVDSLKEVHYTSNGKRPCHWQLPLNHQMARATESDQSLPHWRPVMGVVEILNLKLIRGSKSLVSLSLFSGSGHFDPSAPRREYDTESLEGHSLKMHLGTNIMNGWIHFRGLSFQGILWCNVIITSSWWNFVVNLLQIWHNVSFLWINIFNEVSVVLLWMIWLSTNWIQFDGDEYYTEQFSITLSS